MLKRLIKKSLEENNNNLEEAKIWLRKKGFKEAENRMGRAANIKLIGIKTDFSNNSLGIVLVSCETDFVMRTDYFIGFSKGMLKTILTEKRTIKEEEFEKTQFNSEISQFKGLSIQDSARLLTSLKLQ